MKDEYRSIKQYPEPYTPPGVHLKLIVKDEYRSIKQYPEPITPLESTESSL